MGPARFTPFCWKTVAGNTASSNLNQDAMKRTAHCLFDTPIGRCGIAWSESHNLIGGYSVTQFQLPEATPELTESRFARYCGSCPASLPPAPIAAVMERVRKHLQGETQDFRDVPIDLSESP